MTMTKSKSKKHLLRKSRKNMLNKTKKNHTIHVYYKMWRKIDGKLVYSRELQRITDNKKQIIKGHYNKEPFYMLKKFKTMKEIIPWDALE